MEGERNCMIFLGGYVITLFRSADMKDVKNSPKKISMAKKDKKRRQSRDSEDTTQDFDL
jgi:flagellar motor component MotA